jgi:hypothetical protein
MREDMLRDVDGRTSVRGAIFDDWVCDLYEPAEEGEVPLDLDDDAESAWPVGPLPAPRRRPAAA